MLAERDDGPWIIITGDGRILKNKPERTALRQAGLSGFVLSPALPENANQSGGFNIGLALARNGAIARVSGGAGALRTSNQ
jgi:hypothetical protein